MANPMTTEDKVRVTLLYPLTIVICLSFFVALVNAVVTGEYTPLTVTGPLMFLPAGWVFGSQVIKGARQ